MCVVGCVSFPPAEDLVVKCCSTSATKMGCRSSPPSAASSLAGCFSWRAEHPPPCTGQAGSRSSDRPCPPSPVACHPLAGHHHFLYRSFAPGGPSPRDPQKSRTPQKCREQGKEKPAQDERCQSPRVQELFGLFDAALRTGPPKFLRFRRIKMLR